MSRDGDRRQATGDRRARDGKRPWCEQDGDRRRRCASGAAASFALDGCRCVDGGRARPRTSAIGVAASEDFGLFGAAWNVPTVFWVVGGIDREKYEEARRAGKLDELPANHAPDFAPVRDPTLRVGIEAMVAAVGAWLAPRPVSSFGAGD